VCAVLSVVFVFFPFVCSKEKKKNPVNGSACTVHRDH